MRKRRLKVRKARRKYNYFIIILFIIIPLIAVFIGSRITESIMIPVLYPSISGDEKLLDIINEDFDVEKTNEPHKTEDEFQDKDISQREEIVNSNFSPLSIYLLQVASVSSTDSAEEFAKELNERKLPHLIYNMDNTYKVYTLGATDRDSIEEELTNIRVYYPDAYINEIHLPPKKLAYPKSQEKVYQNIIKDINALIKIMDKNSKEWYNFVKKEGKIDTYVELLVEEKEIVKKISNDIKDNDLLEDSLNTELLTKALLHQEKNIETSLELIEDIENLHKVHSLFLDGLFRMLEIIKE